MRLARSNTMQARIHLLALAFTAIVPTTQAGETESRCRQLLVDRESDPQRLVAQKDFQALSFVLSQWEPQAQDDVTVAQLILDWPGTLDVEMVDQLDRALKKYKISSVPSYSSIRAADGRLRQSLLLVGQNKSMQQFLAADFSDFKKYDLHLFLDVVTIGGMPSENVLLLKRLQLDAGLAGALLNRDAAGSSAELVNFMLVPELLNVLSADFGNKRRGSFNEFASRFQGFDGNDMALAIFARLGRYLPKSQRAEYWQKIQGLGLRKTTTNMARQRLVGPLSKFLQGVIIFAEAYSRVNSTVVPERIHLRGEVNKLLDLAGVPEHVDDISPENEGSPLRRASR